MTEPVLLLKVLFKEPVKESNPLTMINYSVSLRT